MLLIFTIFLGSCSVLKMNSEYRLLPDKNEIIGNDKTSSKLEIKSLYLTTLLGYLFGDSRLKCSEAFYRGYNRMKYPIYEGFKITGCSDTTRAKQMMANHLLKKYGLFRKDTIYLDTIYRIEIVDFDKLPINEDCKSSNALTYTSDNSKEIYSSRTCITWDSFFINIIDHLCSRQHCKPLEVPKGDKMMDLRTPTKMRMNHDISGLLKYYEEVYGLRVTQERIDSVEIVLFKGVLEMH